MLITLPEKSGKLIATTLTHPDSQIANNQGIAKTISCPVQWYPWQFSDIHSFSGNKPHTKKTDTRKCPF